MPQRKTVHKARAEVGERRAADRQGAGSDAPVIVWLSAEEAQSEETVGGKAARLSRLAAGGLPVPDGFVVTVDAYRHFVEANGLSGSRDPGDYRSAPLPENLEDVIGYALRALGDAPLAVRSSARSEDGSNSSYAGIYETLLDVRGKASVVDAIRSCWASILSGRAIRYEERSVGGSLPSMGVIVQRLVPAQAAGVAFTIDPITGDRSRVVINAVSGLGAQLVSGTTTPDEWVVTGGGAAATFTPHGALHAEEALRVAALAKQAEEIFGQPQDVEWALAGDLLYALQSRPVTGLSVEPFESVEARAPAKSTAPPPVAPPPGHWMRDLSHFPRPVSPMARSFYLTTLAQAMTAALSGFGFLLERLEGREIGGYVYARVVPIGGREGKPPPWPLLGLLARLHPGMRAAVSRAREAERSDKGRELARRWWREWRDEFYQEIEEIQSVDLPGLSDEQLASHLDRVLAFNRRAQEVHFLLFVPYMRGVAALALFCERHLGWDARKSMELLAGLSEASVEPARELANLAQLARERPAVLAALTDGEGDLLERIERADSRFAAELTAYQRRFGCRALSEDVIEPTLGERPELTLGMLRSMLTRPKDPAAVAGELEEQRERTAAEARLLLRSRPESTARFEDLLKRAREVYPLREDNSFPTYSSANGLIRLVLLELGRRLSEQDSIDDAEDVMFLEMHEARQAWGSGADMRELVALRKAEREQAFASPGPATYGPDPGPPPDLRALPREAREQMQEFFWFIENDLQAAATPAPGQRGARQQQASSGGEETARSGRTVLTGIAASPGTYRGPARVVRHEGEFEKVRPGDVLVCPITSPSWSVLFTSVGALVSDIGGALSHSSIVAREYGIPAVVATGDATSRLADGQIVTVDGISGRVDCLTAEGDEGTEPATRKGGV